MTVTRKLRLDESAVRAVIDKGGKAAAEEEKQSKKTAVQLRLSKTMLERIDKALARRPVSIPRHTWFLEAIVEKLDREG